MVSWNSTITRIRKYLGLYRCPICGELYDPTYKHVCVL